MQEAHEDPHYQGHYDAAAACPSWAKDWDCMLDGDTNRPDLFATYNKVSSSTTLTLSMTVGSCGLPLIKSF